MRSPILAAFFLCLHAGTAIAEVTIATDKPQYEVGEIVHIEAHNTGPEDALILSTPWFTIVNEDTQECLIGCIGLPEVTDFPAGETVSTDRDTGFYPDRPGRHVVYFNGSGAASTTYLLTGSVPGAAQAWSTLKARYR